MKNIFITALVLSLVLVMIGHAMAEKKYEPIHMEIVTNKVKIKAGNKIELKAMGYDNKNRRLNLNARWTLIVDGKSVATLSSKKGNSVFLRTYKPGTAKIKAVYDHLSAEIEITIIK